MLAVMVRPAKPCTKYTNEMVKIRVDSNEHGNGQRIISRIHGEAHNHK